MDDIGWLALSLFLLSLLLLVLVDTAKEALLSIKLANCHSSVQNKAETETFWVREKSLQLNTALSVARTMLLVINASMGVIVAVDIFSVNWAAIWVSIIIILMIFSIERYIAASWASKNPDQTLKSLQWLLKMVLDLSWLVVGRKGQVQHVYDEDIIELETTVPLEADQHEMIKSIYDLQTTTAREIMIPRVDITAVENNTPVNELVDLMIGAGYSKIPVYKDSIDNIVGVVHARDLLSLLREGHRLTNLEQLIRPAYFIPESKKVDELLREFKEKKITQAMVVDEYGGIAGLVSIKDVLEEIVGEIANEFESIPQIDRLSPTEAVLDAKVSVGELNEEFDTNLETEGFDTVGGLVLDQLGRIATAGDEININGLKFAVISTLGRRITKVKVTKIPPAESASEALEQ